MYCIMGTKKDNIITIDTMSGGSGIGGSGRTHLNIYGIY